MVNWQEETLFSLSRKCLNRFVQICSKFSCSCGFCRFKDFSTRGASLLAQQLLAEIPDQFLLYMRQHNITPNKVRDPTTSSSPSAEATAV
jgi:hypothetical protein